MRLVDGRGVVLAALAGAMTLCVGCADGASPGDDGTDPSGVGTLSVGLSALETDARWLRLRLFGGAVAEDLSGELLYDSGCLEVISETYELKNMPAGTGRTVVFEGFDAPTCRDDERVAFGFRGGVEIRSGAAVTPYFHIPLYREGAVVALPEDLNLSASAATPVNYCDEGPSAQCEGVVAPNPVCFQDKSGTSVTYWCVPSCQADADCADLHPKATCDLDTRWCMVRHPFPLNLSSPRVFGGAAALPDGSVAFVGGFTALDEATGELTAPAGGKWAERFDPRLGIFRDVVTGDVAPTPAGLAGVAVSPGGRVAVVGGATRATLAVTDDGGSTTRSWSLTGADLLAEITISEPHTGRAGVTALPFGLAASVVVAKSDDEFLVFGGLTAPGPGAPAERSSSVWRCTVDGGLQVACVEVATLLSPRAGGAGSCVTDACEAVLLVGGHGSGPVSELVEGLVGGDAAAPTAVALNAPQVPGPLDAPSLCGLDLIGGAASFGGVGGVGPTRLTVSTPDLEAAPIPSDELVQVPVWPAVAETALGCWVFGGVAPSGDVTEAVFESTPAGIPPLGGALVTGRFAAAAAEIRSGPLAGSVLVGGGLTRAGETLRMVRGAELLRP